jgi:polar amino acid transport system substrate-binding protein
MNRSRQPAARLLLAGALVWLAAVLGGCAADQAAPGAPAPAGARPLRVGVTPAHPPLIFKLGDRITGVEADLALRLGQALGRRVAFVEVQWEDQIPALLASRTDIIMSGMSITDARKVRIAFTDAYLDGGLMAVMRKQDAARYSARDVLLDATTTVGVVGATTGEAFVRRSFPSTRVVVFTRPSDGALGLTRRTVDLFVHDAPVVAWLVSENETELALHRRLLTRESLAWGLRREDPDLARINGVLQSWKNDGSLLALLQKWMPYLKVDG